MAGVGQHLWVYEPCMLVCSLAVRVSAVGVGHFASVMSDASHLKTPNLLVLCLPSGALSLSSAISSAHCSFFKWHSASFLISKGPRDVVKVDRCHVAMPCPSANCVPHLFFFFYFALVQNSHYHIRNTSSHMITKAKQHWALSVLVWVTT